MPTRVKCLHALAGARPGRGSGRQPDRRPRARAVDLVARSLRLRRARDRPDDPAARSRASPRRSLARSTLLHRRAAARRRRPTDDPVRAAEYWLDDYGIRDAWQTTRGAGVRIAIIDTGVGRGPVEFEGAVVGGTDVSGVGSSDGRTPVGAVDANHGSWVASLAGGAGHRPGHGHDRRRARGGAAVGLGRLRRVRDRSRSPIRSPRRSAGRSTTAPTSSTSR